MDKAQNQGSLYCRGMREGQKLGIDSITFESEMGDRGTHVWGQFGPLFRD